MKTKICNLFQFEAIIYDGLKPIHSGKWHFFRPDNQKTPTYTGAARMIAKIRTEDGLPTKPKDISVMRIQANSYQTR